jgi:hypothetical protein
LYCIVLWKIIREGSSPVFRAGSEVSELKVSRDVSAIPIPQDDNLAFSNKSEFCTSVN